MQWIERQRVDLDLSVPARREASVAEAIRALWRRRWPIAGVMACATLVAGLAVVTAERLYTSEALVQVDFGSDKASAVPGTGGGIQVDPNALVEGEARLIRSSEVARRVVSRLDLEADPFFAPQPGLPARLIAQWRAPAPLDSDRKADIIAGGLLRKLSVRNDNRSYLIAVAYTSPDPARAAAIANAFAEEYLKTRIEAGVESAQRTSEWLSAQVREVREALAAAEQSIVAYRTESGFVELGAEGGGVTQNQLRDATAQLEGATLAREVAQSRLGKARDAVAAGFLPDATDAADAALLQRLAEAEAEANRLLTESRLAFGARHPQAERAEAAHAAAKERLSAEVRRVLAALSAGVSAAGATEAAIRARVDLLQRAAMDSKAREARIKSLQADAAALRERARILAENDERARALVALKPTVAKIVLPARPSTAPSAPNRLLIVALILGGAGGLSVLGVLLLERRDQGFASDAHVAQVTGLRCLATIPELRPSASQVHRARFFDATRSLAAHLGLFGATPPQVVLFASSCPQEGKSVLSVALAKCLSDAGKRVLVIDTSPNAGGDLRPEVAGLEDLLDGRRELHCEEGSGALVLVQRASGLTDEAAVFGDAFAELIRSARQQYDIVLIEGPPIALLSDALATARCADVAVLAVRWRDTPRALVASAIAALEQTPARLVGVVLTRADPDAALTMRGRRIQAGYFARHVGAVRQSA